MKIYNHINDFSKINNAVVTIGTFDGVHIGHQKIISKLKETAKTVNGETVILTFFPHPRMILHPEDISLKMITTINEKAALLQEAGIDHLIITPFTRDFSNLSPQEYIQNILFEKIGTRKIVIGYDHRFGKNREGSIIDLQKYGIEYGFEVEKIPEQDVNDMAVSSTRIRKSLLTGDVDTANEFLGYSFKITGKVVKGDQLGRTIGFPTANLFVEESYKLIPANGIYAVTVNIDQHEFKGMGYIGHRPSINGLLRNIEVNIFNFNEEIYGKEIQINFLHFVRADATFTTMENLRLAIENDKKVISALLS